MPLYLGTDEAGTNGANLQEFAPTFGQKMGAAVSEAWLESYGPRLTDYLRSRNADDTRRLSAAEAEAMRKDRGGGVRMVLTPKDGEYTVGQWATIIDRQRELAAVKDVRERTPWELGSVLRGGAMFGAGIVDPINLATAFVPWTKSIGVLRGAAVTAETGATLAARTGARALIGAADAGISTAVLEPANYAIARAIGDDYDAVDAMANIAFGTAFGGGVHVLGGAAGDAFRAFRSRSGGVAPVTPDPVNLPPAPLAGSVAGAETRVRVGENYEPARWTVVEADQLQATVDKADNQFRDRSRPAYQAEIQKRANALDPALVLGDSPVMDIGAPTLANDGRIIGGNGRTLFISRAYEIGKGGDYRAALEGRLREVGIDPDAIRGMQKPVLVRQFTRPVDVKRAAMLSNEGGATDMSPLEQAKVDAERLGDTNLQAGADGNIDIPENRAAIRKWVEAMPENKRNAVMDSDGMLSPEGLRRLNAAMLFRAYGDSPTLGRLVEAVDPGSRNIATALGRTAAGLASMRAAIAAGDLHPLDLSPDLQMAVEKFNALREQGMKVSDYLAQMDAFGDGMSDEALRLLEFMGRNIQAPRRLMDAINGFIDRVTQAGNPKQADMFGEAAPPSKLALLQDAIRAADQAGESAAEIAASVSPETREALLRASVAQTADGRAVDVEAIAGLDPSRQTATIDDVARAADRSFSLEGQPLADMDAAAGVEARVAAAPKWHALEGAEAAMAEADSLLADTVKAGQDAFKYSRGSGGVDETTGLPLNADGTVTVYHHTSAAAAAEIQRTGRLKSAAEPDVYVTTRKEADTGYGDTVVAVRVQPDRLILDDEFPDGRQDFRIETGRPGGSVRVGLATGAEILFSRGERGGDLVVGDLTDALRTSFGEDTDALLARGQVQIVATPKDIPGGPHPGDVKAATAPDGTVYVVAENVSPAEARGILLHEVGVHVGMREMLGDDVFGSVLSELDDAIARGEVWAQDARAAVPADTPADLVREEQLAYLVQNAPDLPLVQRIVAAVRAWAYRTFQFARDRMTLSEADFQALAVSALREVARAARVGEGVPAFARAVPQTETKAFRDWFGDSKVVDGEGRPLVVYHGTGSDFSVFDGGRYAENFTGDYGVGFYFTQNAKKAGQYADTAAGGSPNVMPVYLALKNPKIVKAAYADGDLWRSVPDAKTREELTAGLKAQGYDGVIVDGGRAGILYVNEAVAFFPEQIKSAIGNRGTFDPTNPDIRYSRGGTPDPSTAKDELKPYDDAVARAKQFAGVLRAAADKLDNDAQAADAMRAAMPDITPAEINDLMGQLRKQVSGLRGMARSARDAIGAEDAAAALQPEALRAADTLANNLQMAAVIERRNAALNLNARMKASSFLQQFAKPGLDFEGFRALLVGTERKRAGGRLSVDAEQKAYRGEWLGGMIADMERAGVWREFTSGEFDRDVFVALHSLASNEKPQGSQAAVKIAEIVHRYQEDARNTRNRFGAWIRDLSGYITRQTHDMFKIRDAGEKAWADFVLPRLDLQKTLRDFDGSPADFLRRVYDDFAAGQHMKAVAGEDDMQAFGRGASLAKRESASRVLYFKDGNAAYEYNAQFGQGRLAETVLQGLDGAARSVGLLKTLGTNPEAMADRLFREYAENLRGDPARRSAFMARRKELGNLLATVTGQSNIPGNATAAKWAAFSRAWVSMAKLGGMLISSITDLSNYAAELRFGQDKNLLTGVLDGIGALTRGRAKGERAEVLNSLGVFHESMLGAVMHRFDNPDLIGGKTAAAMQQFFKFTGINWWTETLRDAYALSHSAFLADNAGKSYDKLTPALRDMLQLYNIDAGKWDVLRVAPLKAAEGRSFMTPEGLATVPRAVLENYIQQVGRTVSDASVQNLRDDLANALRTMTIDRMHHAVIEPGARTRAFMQRGTQPGTVPGELLRYIGQFKSFPVALIQMTLGREVYGRGYDTLGDYLKNGRGDMLGLASFIALSVGMGYAAMSIKDLLRGKNPRPVDDYRTWMAAFVQGGGLGIYGDFLFGKYNRMGSTLSGSLIGPVAGVADTAADLWTRVRMGDDVAAASFKALLDNTPFLNVFYTRAALDYLILYRIQEALNPGFLRRMERRAQTENGQTYWLPPSEVAR